MATAAGITARRAGVGAVTRWRAVGAGVATGGGSDGEASSRAGAVAAAGGTVGGTVWRATGRSLGTGELCFDGEEAAAFGGWESGCLAGDVPSLVFEEVLSAEELLSAEEVLLPEEVLVAEEALLPEEALLAEEALAVDEFLVGETLAGEDVLAGEAGAEAFCGFSAEEAAGSEFASEKDRTSVKSAERTVDSAVDCKGLARTRGLTAFLLRINCQNLTETTH